jgi:hypothetical protein
MELPHIERQPVVFRLDELILSDEPVNDGPISPGPSQELAHRFLSQGMHGRDAQQIFLGVTRESESIALVADQILHSIYRLADDLTGLLMYQ